MKIELVISLAPSHDRERLFFEQRHRADLS